jgi:hypothetical protein
MPTCELQQACEVQAGGEGDAHENEFCRLNLSRFQQSPAPDIKPLSAPAAANTPARLEGFHGVAWGNVSALWTGRRSPRMELCRQPFSAFFRIKKVPEWDQYEKQICPCFFFLHKKYRNYLILFHYSREFEIFKWTQIPGLRCPY